jgi:hypothetical protein
MPLGGWQRITCACRGNGVGVGLALGVEGGVLLASQLWRASAHTNAGTSDVDRMPPNSPL